MCKSSEIGAKLPILRNATSHVHWPGLWLAVQLCALACGPTSAWAMRAGLRTWPVTFDGGAVSNAVVLLSPV